MSGRQTPISAETLIGLIKESTITKTIKVPDDDFYARSGDSMNCTIQYVCPVELVTLLKAHIAWNGADHEGG